MAGQPIHAVQDLRIAYFTHNSKADPRFLLGCADDFPALHVLDESVVHRMLRDQGIPLETFLNWGENFAEYERLKGLHLLFIFFSDGGKNYLRSVNYMGRYVTSAVMDVSPTCGQLLRSQRLFVVDSVPPIADVKLEDRLIGEAPVWTWLRDGKYAFTCELPGQSFKPVAATIPGDLRVVCQRENVQEKSPGVQEDKVSTEEGMGAVLVYIVSGLATLAAIVLPILFFF